LEYQFLKHLHVDLVFLSLAFFLIRGIWMLMRSSMLKHRWVKILPHIIDTFLLTSAILLAVKSDQLPGPTQWLNIKLAFLLIYIVAGSIALRRGRTRQIKLIAFGIALFAASWMVTTAVTKSPWGIVAVFMPGKL
jgi:uncharacterized membrane protein SirB2